MALENLTTYTEEDPNNDISTTPSRVTVDGMLGTITAYLYKDKGIGHFDGDFEHLFALRITNHGPGVEQTIWAITDALADYYTLLGNAGTNGLLLTLYNGTLYIIEIKGTSQYYDASVTLSLDTTYYLTVYRTGSTFECKIYSDSGRETLVDTITVTLQEVRSYQYIMPVMSATAAGEINEWSGWCENLDLQEAVEYAKTLTESLGLADKVVKAPALLKTEPLGLLDTYSRTWAAHQTYSELLGLSDTVVATRLLVKVLTELLGLSDTVRKNTSKMLTENLGLLDVYGRTWSVYRTYDELLGLADSIKKDMALHPLTEPLGLVDVVVKSPSITKEELLGLKDVISKDTSVTRTELLGLLDTITKGVSLPLTEILALLDTYDRVWAVQRTYTEVLGLEDRVSKHPSKALVEVLGLLDSLAYSKNPTVLAKLIRKFIQLESIGGGGER